MERKYPKKIGKLRERQKQITKVKERGKEETKNENEKGPGVDLLYNKKICLFQSLSLRHPGITTNV